MASDLSRRSFMGAAAATAGMSAVAFAFSRQAMAAGADITAPDKSPAALAQDEAYWAEVASNYDVTDAITNLENGYWGIMARPVLEVFHQMIDKINRENTYYARREWGQAERRITERCAEMLRVETDEVVLTRNATEAMQNLIGGYNRLQPGDGVVYSDLDYGAMKSNMRWLKERRLADVIKIELPEPASRQAYIDAYRSIFDANPHVKMCLLTHINNLTGAILPVAEINAIAEERGITCLVDVAHSLGQMDYQISELGPHFAGINLHKWIGAPIGNGLMYVRWGHVEEIDPHMGEDSLGDDIRKLVHSGTASFGARLTIPAAIAFHEAIGSANKEARLRYLRDLWVNAVSDIEAIQVLSPSTPGDVAGLTSFRLRGKTSYEDNYALHLRLREEFGIMTVAVSGLAHGDAIRVTPSYYTSANDVMKLAAALRKIAG